MKNYYEILGVSENVSKDVLDAVYKKLMENSENMSKEKVQEIQEAYYVLSGRLSGDFENNNDNNSSYVSNVRNVDVKSEAPKEKKNAKWILLCAVIGILIWGINNFLSGGAVTKNSIWGTFESNDGELITLELKEDWDDELYTGYLASTQTPWLKEYIMIDFASDTITYPVTMDSLTFELNNTKLVLQGKTYKKISDECKYDDILDKEAMSIDDITGTYKNASSYYVVVENAQKEDYVNVLVCDNWGKILGRRNDVSYGEFYDNGIVSVEIDGTEYDVYFEQEKLVVCTAYFDGFIKEKEFNATTEKEADVSVKVNEILSNDVIEEYTKNLLVNGAYAVKEYIGDGLISIDDFYIEFTVTEKNKSLDNVGVILAYKYQFYKIYGVHEYSQEYGRVAFKGTINGENIQRIQSDDEVDEFIEKYWTIVQGYKEGYQRVNENSNACWYIEMEDGAINYVYGNWDLPTRTFDQIVDFDMQKFLKKTEECGQKVPELDILQNRSSGEVSGILGDLGFVVNILWEDSDEYEAGMVINVAQAGDEVAYGSTIDVTVSRGNVEWYNSYNSFYNPAGKQLDVSVDEEGSITVCIWNLYTQEELVWRVSTNPNEFGTEGEMIYYGEDDFVMKFYPEYTSILVEFTNEEYAGWYRY